MLKPKSVPISKLVTLILGVAFAVQSLWSQPSLGKSAQDQRPIGYIRSVEGTARIEGVNGDRNAEPIITRVYAGDRIVAESGAVVVCDMRTGDLREVHPGKPLSLDAKVPKQNDPLLKRLRAALNALPEPKPIRIGSTRHLPAMTKWPDGTYFAPQAYVIFRWYDGESGTFELYRLTPREVLVSHIDSVSSPVSWPQEAPRVPGRYRWEVHGKNSASLGGWFAFLSDDEVAERRVLYDRRATREFTEEYRFLGIDLLAAKDGYFLK